MTLVDIACEAEGRGTTMGGRGASLRGEADDVNSGGLNVGEETPGEESYTERS